jgi:hypothetical protein
MTFATREQVAAAMAATAASAAVTGYQQAILALRERRQPR